MNIIKGFNRLFIVLSAISMLPGFIVGFMIYEHSKTINWQSPNTIIRWRSEHKEMFSKFTDKEIINYKIPVPSEFIAYPKSVTPFPDKYEINDLKFLPPAKTGILWGSLSSLLSFFIVLYILKGALLVINWIIVGFKEKSKI